MEDLSLHILDIVENSIAAQAKRIEIIVQEEVERGLLSIEIKDDGVGMAQEAVEKTLDPFFTSRTTRRVGLGIPLFAQATQESQGTFHIESQPGKGTRVLATFQYSHIDRKPWGKMVDTLLTLIIGNPQIDFFYSHQRGEIEYSFATKKIKAEWGEEGITSLKALHFIQKDLEEGLKKVGIEG
ncbi:MAG: ATP-binding protein [Proteobacteria bacterium]|nr:ATP-binding protein [Pseudomonadota bacterium]